MSGDIISLKVAASVGISIQPGEDSLVRRAANNPSLDLNRHFHADANRQSLELGVRSSPELEDDAQRVDAYPDHYEASSP